MPNFVQRTSEPVGGNLYYTKTANGGYNRCILGNSNGRIYPGFVLPNCTGYAWGRYMECQGLTTCNLSTGNAKNWYHNTGDGYARSLTPYLGAVICWSGTNGHVAIVEKIFSNTDIIWSESNWSGTHANGRYWRRFRGNPATYASSILNFQGYIMPQTSWDGEDPVPDPDPDPGDPGDWDEYASYFEAWMLRRRKKKGGIIIL